MQERQNVSNTSRHQEVLVSFFHVLKTLNACSEKLWFLQLRSYSSREATCRLLFCTICVVCSILLPSLHLLQTLIKSTTPRGPHNQICTVFKALIIRPFKNKLLCAYFLTIYIPAEDNPPFLMWNVFKIARKHTGTSSVKWTITKRSILPYLNNYRTISLRNINLASLVSSYSQFRVMTLS